MIKKLLVIDNNMASESVQKNRGLELSLKTDTKPFETNYNTYAFNKSLIYYLTPPDEYKLLRTFLIVDFAKGEKKYYSLYLPKNKEKLQHYPTEELAKEAHEPHHAIQTSEGNIYVFMYKNGNFLYNLDLKNEIARIITINDLGLHELKRIGDTFFIDSDKIYLSGYTRFKEIWKTKLYEATLDLKNIQEIGEYEMNSPHAPHTTLHHKGILMNVHMRDSDLIVYNIAKNQTTRYQTSGCVAGHIERSKDYIYVSNHNFKRAKGGNGLEFIAPAGIDKYMVQEKKLVHKGYFQDPRGFRFTSHKIFTFEREEYAVTVGQPNRLFVIDTENMSLIHYDVIGKDWFPENEDPRRYLNDNQFHMKDMIRPVEVSQNGEYILLISYSYIIMYNFQKRKVTKVLKINDDIEICHKINLKDYKLNTSHTNFI